MLLFDSFKTLCMVVPFESYDNYNINYLLIYQLIQDYHLQFIQCLYTIEYYLH